MHNMKQSHMVEKPCRICKVSTKALKNGQIQLHPVCPRCSKVMAEQFDKATAQRRMMRN
jgi:hypothetical protein